MKPVRVEVSMRLLIDVESYAVVGRILDEIQTHADNTLGVHNKTNKSMFSITGVNTYPCKAIQMNQAIERGYDGQDSPYPMPAQDVMGSQQVPF